MSRDASISLIWGDNEYLFRLRIKELRELQEKCDAGPFEILQRLRSGFWRIDDIRETLRLGLIGGGLQAEKALKLVIQYVDDFAERPLPENVPHAMAVLGAALYGPADEEMPGGKTETAGAEKEAHGTDASPSPSSTAPAPSSD